MFEQPQNFPPFTFGYTDNGFMKNATILAAAIALGIASSTAIAAGDPVRGQAAAATCITCHGADGNSVVPMWPSLAGQHAAYIAEQLTDFRDGRRHEPTMTPMAVGLTDEQILDIAAFYASQTPRPITNINAELAAEGARIYRGGNLESGVAACIACHGPSGLGNPVADFPRVAGQHAQYSAKTLKDFRSGERSNDMAGMMRDIARRMTDEEIAAVAEYMASLP